MTINISFAATSGKAKKQYCLALTEDTRLPACSAQLQAMILAAASIEQPFTLEDLVKYAIAHHGLETTRDDLDGIGAWHRPKLIEMSVIKEWSEDMAIAEAEAAEAELAEAELEAETAPEE